MSKDHVVLICGESKSGKSASMRNLKNVLVANCEAGKSLPFKADNFKNLTITNPKQMEQFFNHYSDSDEYDLAVVDGMNYLFDMYESIFILPAADSRGEWGGYKEYIKNMMQQDVAALTKPIVFLAHAYSLYNETAMVMETSVPVSGATKKNGIESYFTSVIMAKKLPISALEGYENDLLIITDRERKLEYKHVFQTMVTVDTVNTRISTPMGMFTDEETYIDNDIAVLLKRMDEYYA